MKVLIIPLLIISTGIKSQSNLDSIRTSTLYSLLNKSFGTVATASGEAVNLCNYASFAPVAGNFKLNVFGPLSSKPSGRRICFFNASVGGKIIGDNTGILFSDSKFNSGMNIIGKVHIPIKRVITSMGSEVDVINNKIAVLEQEKSDEMINVQQNSTLKHVQYLYQHDTSTKNIYLKESQELSKVKNKIDNQLRVEKDNVEIVKLTDSMMKLTIKETKLKRDNILLQKRIDSLQQLIADPLLIIEGSRAKLYRLDTTYKNRRETLELSLPINNSIMSWITFVGNFDRKKYYTLIDTLSFSQQFRENKFSTFSYGVEINYIHYGSIFWPTNKIAKRGIERTSRISIWNVGLVRVENNNIDEFTPVDMTDSKKYVFGDSSRVVATKYSVYPSILTEYKAWKLYINYYLTIGKKNAAALHFFPDVEFRESDRKPINFGAGVIIGFKNKSDKSILNLEAYVKLIDIDNELPSKQIDLWNRNEIGVIVGIPFSGIK